MSGLIVTRGGIPEPDQGLALRLFKDAAARPPKARYRIVPDRRDKPCTFVLYHCGRRVMDTPELRAGAPSIASIIDWLAAFYAGRK